MNCFCKIRVMRRVRDEVISRIQKGMAPDQAGDEALLAVQNDFVTNQNTAIDWTTLLPEIIQLITLILALFNPPVPPPTKTY